MANELRRFHNWVGGRLTYALPAASTAVADGVTNGTTTITSATAAFTPADVGAPISGTDIPAGAYIATYTNATTVVLSAAATGSGAARAWTISREKVMHSAGLASLSDIDATEHTMVGLDPDGLAGAPEAVMATLHIGSNTWAQITRAQESTVARAHAAGMDWVQTVLATDFDPTYTAYTPTITQSAGLTPIATSSLTAKWYKRGRHVHAVGHAILSAGGTSGQAIMVSLPFTGVLYNASAYPVGTGEIQRVAAGILYRGVIAALGGTTTIRFFLPSVTDGNEMGVNPAFALASGNQIAWNVSYEAAA